jgi:hypothetical protein
MFEANAGAGLPVGNIAIEGKFLSRQVWATLHNQVEQ